MDKHLDLHAVWAETEKKKNVELCFSCTIPPLDKIHIAWIARDVYNLFINGEFVSYGPSRAARGYCRVEYMDISRFLTRQKNCVQFFVQSNNTNTLCTVKDEPLFAATVLQNENAILHTEDFICQWMTDKLSKVERMSSQRGFLEIYSMQRDRFAANGMDFPILKTHTISCPQLLERNVSRSMNERIPGQLLKYGKAYMDNHSVWENDLTRLLDDGRKLDAFKRQDCQCVLSKELQSFRITEETSDDLHYLIYALPRVYCGKFCIQVQVAEKTDLWLTYDDVMSEGYVKFNREHIIHGLKWTLEKGTYTLYSQEVYSAKYIQLVIKGKAEIRFVSMISIENPDIQSRLLPGSNPVLQEIFQAAQNTFAQNAYDIFTDCPSRERAGWLCDSYFLGKAECFFTGKNKVERNFLENYLLYQNRIFPHNGIMPMCYPAEVSNENGYIPNWILWYVLELEDYEKRTGDVEFIRQHRQRIRDILDFFSGYENELGLLENLQGWVFIEWSRATDFVDGINFPTNMLYADALRAAGTILQDPSLLKRSEQVRETVFKMSFNGTVFIDNALRVDGKIVPTDNCSELCQIFAQYFGLAPDSRTFAENFYSGFAHCGYTVCPSALFIGGVLRLMCLYKMERYDLVLHECEERFFPMAERTGTIWEFFDEQASCNHGFGSVIGKLIYDSAKILAKGGKKNEAS